MKKKLGDKCSIAVIDEYSEVGGGSMPLHKLPTKAVTITSAVSSVDFLEKKIRSYKTPVIARISKERLVIDLRTVFDDELDYIVDALEYALTESGGIV